MKLSWSVRALAVVAALVCFGFGPPGPSPRRTRVITGGRLQGGQLQGGQLQGGQRPGGQCLLPIPRRMPEHTRLRFGEAGRRSLHLDLVRPNVPGPHPLVVLVHGGAWRRGHRSDLRGTMRSFAAQGYAAATVDYRLADGTRNVFPGPVSDVRCAVRTLRSRAGELGLDADRVAAVGFSAGGHLVGMLATAADRSGLDDGSCPVPGVSPAVQAAVSFYGPHDLRAPLRVGPGADGAIRNFLGVSRLLDPARTAFASPIAHVDRQDPPMFLVHGVRDRIVEIDQSRRMTRALRAAGVPTQALELPHHRHGFGMFPRRRSDSTRVACATLDFLRERL